MNSRILFHKNRLFWGIAAALGWHLFWAALTVPVRPKIEYQPLLSQAFFLGSILDPADLATPARPTEGFFSKGSPSGEDIPQSAYFQKPSNALYKPTAPSLEFTFDREPPLLPVPPRTGPDAVASGQWTVTPADVSRYLEGVDFSGFAYQFSREDLFPFMDFDILLTPQGRARHIRKVAGSGDPALDLACMRLLKKGVFKIPVAEEKWIRLRLLIKE